MHAVASTLAERGMNITDLTSRLVEEASDEGVYAMALEVALPEALEADALERALDAPARDQGVELSFRALEQTALRRAPARRGRPRDLALSSSRSGWSLSTYSSTRAPRAPTDSSSL